MRRSGLTTVAMAPVGGGGYGGKIANKRSVGVDYRGEEEDIGGGGGGGRGSGIQENFGINRSMKINEIQEGKTNNFPYQKKLRTEFPQKVQKDEIAIGYHEMKLFKCLYSHQKLKKKKTWLDGELKILKAQKRCILYKIDENNSSSREVLDSKYCPDIEIDRILNGIADSVEFEKYLVEIDQMISSPEPSTISSTSVGNSIKKVELLTSKLKKTPFKVPQTVAPVEEITTTTCVDSKPGEFHTSSKKRGYYSIDDDELDDIWDSTHQVVLNQQTNSNESLALLDFNFESRSTLAPTGDSSNFSSIFSSKESPSKNSIREPDISDPQYHIYSHQHSPQIDYNYEYENDDSTAWPRYNKEDGLNEETVDTSSQVLEASPPKGNIPKAETNIWSRLFDTSQIGLVDEFSN